MAALVGVAEDAVGADSGHAVPPHAVDESAKRNGIATLRVFQGHSVGCGVIGGGHMKSIKRILIMVAVSIARLACTRKDEGNVHDGR